MCLIPTPIKLFKNSLLKTFVVAYSNFFISKLQIIKFPYILLFL